MFQKVNLLLNLATMLFNQRDEIFISFVELAVVGLNMSESSGMARQVVPGSIFIQVGWVDRFGTLLERVIVCHDADRECY
jgi:hypothetical protein